MESLPSLIIDLTILLGIAAVTTLLCKKINLPSVLGYILAGFLAGPVVAFFPTIHDMANIETWSDIGVIFLMFGLGLEFSIHKMAEVGVPGILSAVVQAAGVGLMGFFLGEILRWSTMDSIFLGVMLAMSSTMITMKNIEDMGLKESRFAGLAMGTLVIEDLIAIFAMVILSTIAVSKTISGPALAGRVGLLLFYLALWLILGIFLVPTVMKKLVGLMNDEVLLIFSLALCFLMALLAEEIGLSTELGAFLAGSLLAGTVHAERVEHLVTPCKNLFGAIFFISVGFMVQPGMIWKYLGVILLLSVAAILGKLLFLTLGSLAAGQPLEVSLQSAASQTQVGEFSFILAGLGLSLSVTSEFLYPVIVAVSVVTTFTTPFVLRGSVPLCRKLEQLLPDRWLEAIERYVQDKEREPEEETRDWPLFLRKYFSRFGLYTILAMGTILLGIRLLMPRLMDLWGEEHLLMAKLVTCAVMYGVLLVLIPAMLRVPKRFFTALWIRGLSNRVLLSLLVTFRFGVAVVLLVAPAFLVFQVNPLFLALAAIPIIFLARRSGHLAGRYLEFEARFLANLNERKLADWRSAQKGQEKTHHWLTEEMMVAVLTAEKGFGFQGESLKQLRWGNIFHIKVIKIQRGREHINIPEGHVRLYEGDRLVLTGSQRQLENFCQIQAKYGLAPEGDGQLRTLKAYIEDQESVPESKQILLYGVELDKDMPQVDKSVRTSGIKHDWSAFLVGIERDLLPILDPSPAMLLRAGDLLWVMGSQEMATKLAQAGLLDY